MSAKHLPKLGLVVEWPLMEKKARCNQWFELCKHQLFDTLEEPSQPKKSLNLSVSNSSDKSVNSFPILPAASME